MRYIFTLIVVFMFSSMVFSQDAKWYVGMHGGPMLNITEDMSGQKGFQLAPGIYFSKNQRFEIGLLPSYTKFVIEGYSDVPTSVNESYVLSDRIQTHHTGMMNAQVRYTFNTRMLQPYGIAHWGVGIIHQVDEQEVWYGGTTTDTYGAFSFGFGLGLQYILTNSLRLDFNIQASGIDDFGERTPEYFIRPLLGVIMQI